MNFRASPHTPCNNDLTPTNECVHHHVHVYHYVFVCVGKLDVFAVKNLISSHGTLQKCSSLLSCTSTSLSSLITSSAAQILGLYCWPEEKNLLMLGATSFDVLRLLNELERQLAIGEEHEGLLGSLFEALMTKSLHNVVITFLSLLSSEDITGKESTVSQEMLSGTKRTSSIADLPIVPTKKVSVITDATHAVCWRRGQTQKNGRFVT